MSARKLRIALASILAWGVATQSEWISSLIAPPAAVVASVPRAAQKAQHAAPLERPPPASLRQTRPAAGPSQGGEITREGRDRSVPLRSLGVAESGGASARLDREPTPRSAPAPVWRWLEASVEETAALRWTDVARDPVGVLAHARGHDEAGPRELALWRVDPASGQAALLSRSSSAADGRFRFERLLVSQRAIFLVVSDGSESPHGEGASLAARLDAARLPPPSLRLQADESTPQVWHVRGHVAAGARLRVADPLGATRREITPATRFAAQRNPSLRLLAPRGEQLLIAQETPDGRRSGWVALAEPPAPSAELPAEPLFIPPEDSEVSP